MLVFPSMLADIDMHANMPSGTVSIAGVYRLHHTTERHLPRTLASQAEHIYAGQQMHTTCGRCQQPSTRLGLRLPRYSSGQTLVLPVSMMTVQMLRGAKASRLPDKPAQSTCWRSLCYKLQSRNAAGLSLCLFFRAMNAASRCCSISVHNVSAVPEPSILC